MHLFAEGLKITYRMMPNSDLDESEISDEEVECLLAVMIDKVI
jgi:hypothetical protein